MRLFVEGLNFARELGLDGCPHVARGQLDAAWAARGTYMPDRFISRCTATITKAGMRPADGDADAEHVLWELRQWADGHAAETLAACPELQPDGADRPFLLLCEESTFIAPEPAWAADLARQSPLRVLPVRDDRPLFLLRASDAGRDALDLMGGAWYALVSEDLAEQLGSEPVRNVVSSLLRDTVLPAGASLDALLEAAISILREPVCENAAR